MSPPDGEPLRTAEPLRAGEPQPLPAPAPGSVLRPRTVKRLPRLERDRLLTRSLRENNALITRRELVKLGFGRDEILGLVDRGDLRCLHRGVYADGRARLTDHAYLKAALLAFPASRGAWLSGPAAEAGWQLDALSLPRLEVSVVARATPRQRPRLRVHSLRTPPYPTEIRTRNGLRMSSIPRLLIEISAQGAAPERLHRRIDQAVGRDLLDIPDLAATLTRNHGCAGTAGVKRVCAEYLPHADRKSGLERAFDRWLTKHPEIPLPERNIRLGPWEIDCYWPEHNVALELDGRAYHTVIEDIERDRRKDAWLQIHRHRFLRVTDSRFRRDRNGVGRDLMALLELSEAGPERS